MKSLSQFSVKCFSVEIITVNQRNTGFLSDKVKKMLFVSTIWLLCKKGGYLKSMGAVE